MKQQTNSYHIDWLEFTYMGDEYSFGSLMTELGVPLYKFESSHHGLYGYEKCLFFQTAFVLMHSDLELQDKMGFHVVIPATSLAYFNVKSLFDKKFSDKVHCTRLDIAFDIYDDLQKEFKLKKPYIQHVYDTASNGFYKSHVKKENIRLIQNMAGGMTMYVGSTKSNTMLRIYDKAAEQGTDFPWIRFEYQLRHETADSYFSVLNGLDSQVIGEALLNLMSTFFVLCSRGLTNVTKQSLVYPEWDKVREKLKVAKPLLPKKRETSSHPFYRKLRWFLKQAGPTFAYFANFYDDWDWLDYRSLLQKFLSNYKEFLHYSTDENGCIYYDDWQLTDESFSFEDLKK